MKLPGLRGDLPQRACVCVCACCMEHKSEEYKSEFEKGNFSLAALDSILP